MKKIISLMLIYSISSFPAIVYANTTNANTSNNRYSNSTPYIEFGVNTTGYQNNTPVQTQNPLRGGVVKISKGTSFDVYLQDDINTANAEPGETVTTMVKEDFVINNSIVIPQGSSIQGKVVTARHAGRAGRNGKVSVVFNRLILPEGETYQINAEKIDFEVNNDGSVASSAAVAAGTIIFGAVAGSLLSGSSYSDKSKDKDDYVRGAATGAILTGAALLGYALIREGKDAVIPQYTEIAVTLEDPLDLPASNKY